MNADQLVVFDTEKRQVVANLDGLKRVHGVIAVPEIDRVYASVTGEHQVAAVDMNTLKTVARTGPVTYPDGLAYSPTTKRVFVSDERGGVDAVIDANSNKLLLAGVLSFAPPVSLATPLCLRSTALQPSRLALLSCVVPFVALYPEWQKFLRNRQPKILIFLFLYGIFEFRQRSRVTFASGCEQQTSTFPGVGLSRGSGL